MPFSVPFAVKVALGAHLGEPASGLVSKPTHLEGRTLSNALHSVSRDMSHLSVSNCQRGSCHHHPEGTPD